MTITTRKTLVAVSVIALGGAIGLTAQSTGQRRAVDELLATDRAHAKKALTLNVVDAIGGMIDDNVTMSAARAFRSGRSDALAQLRSVPENLTGHLEWSPVRVGISADGQHGFTYGFMTLVRADSTRVPLKYLAYWIKRADGWKVAVYKRARRPEGDVSTSMREPSTPSKSIAATTDASVMARHARELGQAERAFSTLAGKIGLGPAFTQNAAPDAMNMGGGQSPDFLYGPQAIGAGVGAGESGPSTLTWGPDTVLVASSGDLGVTIGHINAPASATTPAQRFPFFTIWKKVGGVWKFVVE